MAKNPRRKLVGENEQDVIRRKAGPAVSPSGLRAGESFVTSATGEKTKYTAAENESLRQLKKKPFGTPLNQNVADRAKEINMAPVTPFDPLALTPQEIAKREDFLRATGSEIIPSERLQGTGTETTQPKPKTFSGHSPPVQEVDPVIAAGIGGAVRGEGITAAGAGIGAALGLAGGPLAPLTVTGGAIAGGAIGKFIAGFVKSSADKLEAEADERIKISFTGLKTHSKNARLLIIDAKTNPEQAYKAFQAQLNAIDQQYQDLQKESHKNLNAYLAVDTDFEMSQFDAFYASGGVREIYINRMKAVIMNPRTDVSDLLYPSDLEGIQTSEIQ